MNRSKKLVAMALLHNDKDEATTSKESSLSNSSKREVCDFKNIAEHQSTSHVSPTPHDLSSNESSVCSVSSKLEKLFGSNDCLFDKNYSSNTEVCDFKNIAEHQSTSHVSPSPHYLSSSESSVCSVSSELEKLFSSDDSFYDQDYKPPLSNDTDLENDQHDKEGDIPIPEREQTKKSTQGCSRQINKTLRVLGKPYLGYKGDKGPRLMKMKICNHIKTVGKSKRSYMCGAINDDTRKTIFQHFWSINCWDSKKSYLKGLVEFRTPKRRRKDTNSSNLKKHYVYDCYLPKSDGCKVRVCRSFFLCTLDIKKDSFCSWIKENNPNVHKEKELSPEGKSKETKTMKNLKSDSVLEWLNMLPKVESHYCRASTSRTYLESTFNSASHMHTVFKEWCQENQKSTVERKKFCEIMKREKISIFKPRKDQCDTCVLFKEGNLPEEEYQQHMIKKEEARQAKQAAIANMSDEILVVTMDVQSVLLSPKLLVSKQYYSQKLQVHNFTIYISNNKDVHLYVWSEENGNITSNEFTSCIINFIQKHSQLKKIVLISDGCAYQNKNRVLASALLDFTIKFPIEIEQIILEKGHTMMEVDSVHSTLEQLFKPPIYTPSHYIEKMRQARKRQPYIINHLDYTFFKNYEKLRSNFTSIRPGKKTGDPTVTDIRGMRYQNGEVFYKLRHSDDWKSLPQRRTKPNETTPTQLYKEPKKIEKKKFQSLQALKVYMHKDYQLFYENLKSE